MRLPSRHPGGKHHEIPEMDGDTFTSDETAVVVDIPFEGNEGDGIYFKPEMIAKFVADHAA